MIKPIELFKYVELNIHKNGNEKAKINNIMKSTTKLLYKFVPHCKYTTQHKETPCFTTHVILTTGN